MAISFVAGSKNQGEIENTTPLTVTKPAGTAEDDLLIAVCQSEGNNVTWVDDSAAWTQVENHSLQGAGVALFIKIAGASEAANYDFSTTTGTLFGGSVVIGAFRGVDTADWDDVTYVQGTHYAYETTTTAPTPAAITTNTNGAWVIVTCGHESGGTISIPSGYTLVETQDGVSASGIVSMAYKAIPTATTETPGDFTTDSANCDMITLAIKPAAAGGLSIPIIMNHYQQRRS